MGKGNDNLDFEIDPDNRLIANPDKQKSAAAMDKRDERFCPFDGMIRIQNRSEFISHPDIVL